MLRGITKLSWTPLFIPFDVKDATSEFLTQR
jgi:hypothetical protein